MSQFNYADYQKLVEKAQNGGSNAVKVGYFKLKDDGDEALVRINCGSVDDLDFAAVHTISANGRWMRVSCLNPLGDWHEHCPLCEAANNGKGSISKASKKVYIQMLVSYKDKTTGTWSAPIPVIWERPAGFSREIANKLRDFKDLRNVILKITRNGKAGDMKTTYSLDYLPETIVKQEMIPADFSAFNNFNIAKHSYWEKSEAEIAEFLATGSFPEVVHEQDNLENYETPKTAYQANTVPPVTPVAQTPYVAPQPVKPTPAPTYSAPTPTPVNTSVTPQADTVPSVGRPIRNFNGFSF